jgi:hypothetical protein
MAKLEAVDRLEVTILVDNHLSGCLPLAPGSRLSPG